MGTNCSKSSKASRPIRVIRVEQRNNASRSTDNNSDEIKPNNPNLTIIGLDTPELSMRFDSKLHERHQKALPNFRKDLKIGEFYLETASAQPTPTANQNNPSKKPFPTKKPKLSLAAKIRSIETIVAKTKKNLGPQRLQRMIDEMYTESDACIDYFSKRQTPKFQAILVSGPPMKYRWAFWKAKLNIEKYFVDGLYEKFLYMTTPCEIDIKKDVSRTFPDESFFATGSYGFIGQSQLFNVLKAISLYFPNIGYCQGMNFVIGFILLINGGRELEAFWFFVTLARSHEFMLGGLFEPGFPLLELYLHIFNEMLQKELPHIYDHIKVKNDMPDIVWISKWILTLFLYSLPASQVTRVWDYMISEDIFALIKLSLGLLKYYEKLILKLDVVGFNDLMKLVKADKSNKKVALTSDEETDLTGFTELNMDMVIHHAKKIKLAKSSIAQMTKKFLENRGSSNIYYQFYLNFEKNVKSQAAIEEFQKDVDSMIIELHLREEKAESPAFQRKHSLCQDEDDGGMILEQLATLRREENIQEAKNSGVDEDSEGDVEADSLERPRPQSTQTKRAHSNHTKLLQMTPIKGDVSDKQAHPRESDKVARDSSEEELESHIYEPNVDPIQQANGKDDEAEIQIIRRTRTGLTFIEVEIKS